MRLTLFGATARVVESQLAGETVELGHKRISRKGATLSSGPSELAAKAPNRRATQRKSLKTLRKLD